MVLVGFKSLAGPMYLGEGPNPEPDPRFLKKKKGTRIDDKLQINQHLTIDSGLG
jgi:hypothetical protein